MNSSTGAPTEGTGGQVWGGSCGYKDGPEGLQGGTASKAQVGTQQGRARHDMGLHDMEIIPGSFGANEQMPQGTTYQELERDDGKGHSKTPASPAFH